MKRLILLLIAVTAHSQTNRGAISGTITDASGAAVPRAQITITNIGANRSIKLQSAGDGAYSAPSLDPVEYRVTVQAAGFQKAVVEHVKVDTATTASVNVKLETGNVETQITVTAEAAAVNAESGTLGQTINERQIQNLPLNNRSVLDLAVTLPNVSGDVGSEDPAVTSGATAPGYNLSLNGGRPGSTAILADGVNNTGVGLARAIVSFSPETVQEFTVQTSAYSAEFGQTGGGVINATTKSGTNKLNGTLLWYSRNPAINAAPFSIAAKNRPLPNLRSNQFSATAGGPIVVPKLYDGRNKSFFFAAFEPRYRMDSTNADALLPTDAMRTGNFSDAVKVDGGWAPAAMVEKFGVRSTGDSTIYRQFNLVGNQLQRINLAAGQLYQPFPNNTIPPAYIDPTSVKAMQYLPRAGDYYLNPDGKLVNFYVRRFVKQDENRYLARLDHNFSDKLRLNFRITEIPAIGKKGFGSDVNGNVADYSFSRQLMAAFSHTVTPTVLNDLRLNYTRGVFSSTFTPEFDPRNGSRNLSTELGLPSLTKGGLPTFSFELGSFGNIGSGGSTLLDNVEERYNIADIVYFTRRNMSWKFGVDISHSRLASIPLYLAAGGAYDFRYVQTNSGGPGNLAGIGFASFLLGVPNSVQLRGALIPYYYRYNSGAGFVQNDWKLKPNLTLNLGLRYSLQLPRTEKYNRQGVFLPELAKDFPLAAPLSLVDGRTITSAKVPPFAYSGLGGRSRYLTPVSYFDFEPRFGFAWSPQAFKKLTVRGGYGLSHAPLTGNARRPNPDFGVPTQPFSATSGQVDPNFALRLSSNPPNLIKQTPEEALNIPADGLVYLNSINIPGFAISSNVKTPYAQNWNFTLNWQPIAGTVIEAAYVGSKGTHLFMPGVNVNPRDFGLVDALQAANQNPDATTNDPLGRRDPNGRIIAVQNGTLASRYLGINRLNILLDSSANSIRHATYISLIKRSARGLTLTANYTFAKSIDDASDASPERFALTTARTDGQATFGGARSIDRSVSIFDVKHNFNSTFLYDLPFARNKLHGGWTLNGVFRLMGGYPFVPTMEDSNKLGDGTHTIRPNIVPGVPLLNPLWTRDCPLSNACEPYINPAAFQRPPKGQLGTAPRTLDGGRGPIQPFTDLSVQKNFRHKETRFRAQLRVDFINVFNHPTFRNGTGTANTDIFNAPVETPVTAAEYDTWARFNNRPLAATPQGQAALTQAQSIITSSRRASGTLPDDFFTAAVPQGFASANANSFDITDPKGYKLYRLRQAYRDGFGQLYAPPNPRYIQFGLKLFF